MAKISTLKAINEACFAEFERDPKVITIGEAVGKKGGAWGYFTGLTAKYGEERTLDMPIAEAAFSGFAIAAAMRGWRPIVEYMFADFITVGAESVINTAAKARYNSAGVNSVPIVFILPAGGGMSGSQHSQSVEQWFSNVPGIKIVAPTFPADIKAYLQASIRDNDPVVFIFQRALLGLADEVPENLTIPTTLGNASKVVREGKNVTVVTYQRALINTLKAADELAAEGITVDIIDPIVIRPFDMSKIIPSVKKTGKALIVHEAHKIGGFGMQISALIAENCLKDLKKPVVRIGGKDGIIPFGVAGEKYMYPTVEDIKDAIRELAK